MAADSGVLRVTVGASPAAGTAPALGALTRRASRTALASLLDYAAKIAVGLVVTPIMVSGLGRSLFGVWEMLVRLMSYAHAADGRPTEALRLVIARHLEHRDDALKHRQVGAAVAVWALVLPAVAAIGTVVAWFAPRLTGLPAAQHGTVRLTCLLLIASFLAASLASVPESVLRGMNLGYRRMGVQASLNVAGGGLAAFAVWAGLGLTGLATAQILRGCLTGLCFLVLTRRVVPWFGAAWPRREEVRALFGMSVWLSAGELVSKLLLASDVLVLGAVVSPAAVTSYVLTGYAARTALGLHFFAAGSAMAGMGGVLGQRQLARAAQARREMLTLTWLMATSVGVTILLWNRSFLTLWVGHQHYAGAGIDLLIVLVMVQTALIRTDAYIIDAALQPRQRVIMAALAAAVVLGLTTVLSRPFGVTGVCIGMLLGRAVQSLGYPALVRRHLGVPARTPPGAGAALRLAAWSGAAFAVASAAGRHVTVSGWAAWAVLVALTFAAATLLALATGPTAEVRRGLLARLRAMAAGLREGTA